MVPSKEEINRVVEFLRLIGYIDRGDREDEQSVSLFDVFCSLYEQSERMGGGTSPQNRKRIFANLLKEAAWEFLDPEGKDPDDEPVTEQTKRARREMLEGLDFDCLADAFKMLASARDDAPEIYAFLVSRLHGDDMGKATGMARAAGMVG